MLTSSEKPMAHPGDVSKFVLTKSPEKTDREKRIERIKKREGIDTLRLDRGGN